MSKKPPAAPKTGKNTPAEDRLRNGVRVLEQLHQQGLSGDALREQLTLSAFESGNFQTAAKPLGKDGKPTTSASGSHQIIDETYMDNLYALAKNEAPTPAGGRSNATLLQSVLSHSKLSTQDHPRAKATLQELSQKWDTFVEKLNAQKEQEYEQALLRKKQGKPPLPAPKPDPNAPKTRFDAFMIETATPEQQKLVTQLLSSEHKDLEANQAIIGDVNGRINATKAKKALGNTPYTPDLHYLMHHLGKDNGPVVLAAYHDPKMRTLPLDSPQLHLEGNKRPIIYPEMAKRNPALMMEGERVATVEEYVENIQKQLKAFQPKAQAVLSAACYPPKKLGIHLTEDVQAQACALTPSTTPTQPAPKGKPTPHHPARH